MNKNLHITDQAALEQLINRYFDGETSVQEERELREALADCPWSSEFIDEARFTMGYFAAHKQQQQPRVAKKSYQRQIIGIAASIAILLGIGLSVFSRQWLTPRYECIAYVNGKVIADNQEAIMSLIAQDLNDMDMATREMAGAMANDMSEMNEASRLMTDELSSLGDAIELDD